LSHKPEATMKKMTVIESNGTITQRAATDDLQELQSIVGGYIEAIRTVDNRRMFVNEDGTIMRLMPNAKASALAGRPIVGDVCVFD
jgi:hypothetical protein